MTSPRKQLIFGWCIFSLVSLVYARAIAVSSSPLVSPVHQRRSFGPRKKNVLKNKNGTCHQEEGDGEEQRYHGCTDILDPSKSLEDRFPFRGGAASATKAVAGEKAWVEGAKNSLASALAAAFSKTILAPFDTIKTLQQYHQTSPNMPSLSLMEAAKIIMERPGGFLNFYAGLGVSVLGAMPSVALYFGTYSYCKKALGRPRTRSDGTTYTLPRTFVVGMSAAIGNTLASFSRVPYEVLKQKLQTNTYRTTWEAIRDVTSWDMIFPKGGVTIQMMRDIPYAVVTLLLYEHLQAWSISRQQQLQRQQATSTELQKASSDMILGAMSGGMGSWVTNPLDVIKTRLQTAPYEVYEGSIGKCFVETWKEGGGMAFLRGSWPRLMHKIPANGMFFLFYEFFRRLFKCQGYDDQS